MLIVWLKIALLVAVIVSLSLALMHLIKNDMQEIPVVENGKLVGLIGNKEILKGGF